MESWRERGYVPDSDEEDGFDSLDAKKLSVKEAQGTGKDGEVEGGTEEGSGLGGLKPGQEDEDEEELAHDSDDSMDELQQQHGGPSRITGKGNLTVLTESMKDLSDDEGTDSQTTPVATKRDIHNSSLSSNAHASPKASPPTTPRAKQPQNGDGVWDIPSSSPDELQMDFRSARKPMSLPERQTSTGNSQRDDGMVDDSPLSSPPSSLQSLQSLRLDEDENEQAASETQNGRNTSTGEPEKRPEINLEDLLPPLDIPEDMLEELSRPGRRSLRQRNPIQLHPYLLEDANYQKLMKARGVRPVRIAQYQQALRDAAARNEGSQDQSFDHSAHVPSSSPMGGDFEPPASSPSGLQPNSERRLQKTTPVRLPARSPRAPSSRSAKRLKVSHTDRDDGASRNVGNNSVFDVPLSPPRSGSVSSAYTAQRPSGFRFPRGFTPPPLSTPATDSRLASKDGDDGDDGDAMDLSVPDNADNHSVSDASVSSQSQQGSDGEDDQPPDQDYSVKSLQRRIKGVLPASWLRLDQQKQKENQLSSTQRNREKILAQRLENAKGVAKKVVKKSDSATTPNARAQLTSLINLADSDSDESDNNAPSAKEGSHLTLADVVGFEDPQYGDDDIPEDNRIDNIFPPVPRGPSSPRSKHGTKRTRLEKSGSRSGNQQKRPRLKRQTRLTDNVASSSKRRIDGRRTKRSPSTRPPKLSILDAPDVAERPRQEQPQFLRVAARQVQSRRDRGRRSPTRKFIDLGSKKDTEDANKSLRDWKKGNIRQTRLTQPQRKPQRRPPLVDLTTNGREIPEKSHKRGDRPRETNPGIETIALPDEDVDISEQPASQVTPVLRLTSNSNTSTSKGPAQFGRYGTKWVIRRNLAISSLKRNTPRPAGLETENTTASTGSPSFFQSSLSLINQDYRQKRFSQARQSNLTLDRFLSDSVSSARPRTAQETTPAEDSNPPQIPAKRRQLKKRPPKRLDPAAIGDNQEPEPSTNLVPENRPPSVVEVDDDMQPDAGREHAGLSSFQRSYTVDFDVAPCTGSFFHESTFLGSGEFFRSLSVLSRDMDQDSGLFRMVIGDQSSRWGAWNDSVSSELGLAFEKLVEGIEIGFGDTENQPRTIYRSIIKYAVQNLSFLDPVDRAGFVTRVCGLISNLNDQLASTPTANCNVCQLAAYNLVFANLVFQIASNDLVNDTITRESVDLVKSTARQAVASFSCRFGLTDIRDCLAEQKLREKREYGIRDNHPAVEAYVITQHVLRRSDHFKGLFANLVAEACLASDTGDLSASKNVTSLEGGWHSVFTILPLNEIDETGVARVGSRFKEAHDNWPVIKQLLQPVLDEYDTKFMPRPVLYNNYCRVLFHRCFHLINGWGWRNCKPILDTLYDFFAKNTLYNLKHEESFGSPAFLEDLDRNPSLEVRPGEPCFHTLLKIIASGLRFMSRIYDKKKIRNFAWRLLPNHGRVYPKEMPIRHEDLDALRNHHDLLCTLYYAVPDGCRPRLEAVKNLVHPGSSHREACDISLRSWGRLTRFKLSTDEDAAGLDPFADWHSYFVTEVLKQHSLARKEVEAQINSDSRFTKQMVEGTISQNQRQIESLLNSAINGLQNAIQLAPQLEHARRVVAKFPIKSILGLFNARVARVNVTVSQALHVVISYTNKCVISDTASASAPAATDEDSQEYGDWAAIEAMYGGEVTPKNEGIEHLEKVFHPAVSRLVSNCFGEDHSPEDKFLLDAVDCWSSIAQVLVNNKLRHWDNYLSPYEGDSWASLRSTVQTRKFTPQFLAQCIEKDSGLVSQCKVQLLGMWMSTLVERTSMLKFQHRLTGALLNEAPMDPLFDNLPFSKDREDGRYFITLEDFSQRRLSLISSLLSNMREHLQDLEDTESPMFSLTKEEYRELIQKLMSSMRFNYQELGNSGQSAQGAYVDFVHRVVGFLQQHSRDISPIDSFFTDPTSFPLPSTDPSYIVARLKSYEPKLSAERVARTLIIFVQGVSERAAIDGQQVYLVDQLHASITDTYETGSPNRPTLRGILLRCVFPAYLENAFHNRAAWILSLPILQAVSRTFKDLLFNMSTTDSDCVSSVLGIMSSIFQSSLQALRHVVYDPSVLKAPTVLATATAFIETVTAALPVLDYICRVTDIGGTAISQAQVFRSFGLFAVLQLRGLASVADEQKDIFTRLSSAVVDESTSRESEHSSVSGFFDEARRTASRELRTYLNESWSRHQGKYYFTRRGGHRPQEVTIDTVVAAKLENSPVEGFENAVGGLLRMLTSLDVFGDT